MTSQSEKIRKFILKNVGKHSRDIVSFTAKYFSVNRMRVYRYLQKLILTGEIIKTGITRKAFYILASSFNKELSFVISEDLSEFKVWEKYLCASFSDLSSSIFSICEYGFTEMFNNAIDHSNGKHIFVEVTKNRGYITIEIADDGIGIFQKINKAFKLGDKRESILSITKGKLTTDPENHTGEGIFFTSKMFDQFSITANNINYTKDNVENDWFVEGVKYSKGTKIGMKISLDSTMVLRDIFNQFTNPETYEFDKTQVDVQLCKLEEERYISRSQAKRLLSNLSEFKCIILDFKKVTTVGQGFVDEVFRVFKKRHPNIKIEYVNANEDVEFMLKRGLVRD